jgi:hypothetical protein
MSCSRARLMRVITRWIIGVSTPHIYFALGEGIHANVRCDRVCQDDCGELDSLCGRFLPILYYNLHITT